MWYWSGKLTFIISTPTGWCMTSRPSDNDTQSVGVFFCDSLDLCYDPCHVIKHES